MSNIPKALVYVDALQRELDAWKDHQKNKNTGGQSVGYHHAQFYPSSVTLIEWHLREIRTALTSPEEPCPECEGTGKWQGCLSQAPDDNCPDCGGSGEKP